MSKPIAKLLLAAVTILTACAAGTPTLVVQVRNLSHADSRVVSQAEGVAGRVFSEAGIQTAWVTTDKPAPRKLTIQINRGRSNRSEWKDSLGIAITDDDPARSFLADVFFGNIEEIATTRTDEAFLLGYVMAHEVGHLLGLPHAPQTVMAESWNGRDIRRMEAGRIRFSASEAERLYRAVIVHPRSP